MCVVFLGLQLAFYTHFMEQNPNFHISLWSFERFKPWFVKTLEKILSFVTSQQMTIGPQKLYKWL